MNSHQRRVQRRARARWCSVFLRAMERVALTELRAMRAEVGMALWVRDGR